MNLNWLSFWGHLLSRELLQVLHDHHLWDRDSWPVSWGSGYVDGECLGKKCCLDLSQLGFDWTSLITYWQQWRFFALWLSSCHHHHRHPSGLSKEISVPMLDQTCANITASFSCLSFAVGKETFSSYKYSMICFSLKIHHLESPFFTEELQPNFCYDPNTVVRSWNPSICYILIHKNPGPKGSEISVNHMSPTRDAAESPCRWALPPKSLACGEWLGRSQEMTEVGGSCKKMSQKKTTTHSSQQLHWQVLAYMLWHARCLTFKYSISTTQSVFDFP